MQDEYVDVIDESNRVISRGRKAAVHADGRGHRVSAVLLQHSDGRFLIPTASEKKVERGRLYHSAAGHVAAGESYQDAALRELKEETGIMATKFEFLGSFWFEKNYPSRIERERFEVYIAHYDGREKIVLNDEQVNEHWLTKEELLGLWHKQPKKVSDPLKMTCKLLTDSRS